MAAKEVLKRNGLDGANIHIVGQSLVGVPSDELVGVDEFKDRYDEAFNFDTKVVVITVAGFRAGINFGQEMKETLIGSWDSTISNVAAVVQANIGRACGYHTNSNAVHYTNSHAVRAYAEVLDYLENNCTANATDDIPGLRSMYELVCKKYDVRGLDAGATVTSGGKVKSVARGRDVYLADSYILVPARLSTMTPDFSAYTEDPLFIEAISLIRDSYLGKEQVPVVKSTRQLKGAKWIAANWVNGDTYDNPEKASALGTYHDRLLEITTALNDEHDYSFNDVVVGGGGINNSEKTVAAYIFSVYNESRRVGASQRTISQSQLDELAEWFEQPTDDTFIFLVRRGAFSQVLTDELAEASIRKAGVSSIAEHNHFMQK